MKKSCKGKKIVQRKKEERMIKELEEIGYKIEKAS